jgi:hypothetical protein
LRELNFLGPITVVERDPTYRRSSTALSAASIRTQFGTPVNVRMSLFGAQFLRSIQNRFGLEASIGFVERGYFILGGSGSVEARQAGIDIQRREGAAVVALSPEEA